MWVYKLRDGQVQTAQAFTDKRITVHGGSQWRPLLHVRDSARALVERHREDLRAVITATNTFVTAPIAREFGIEHLIATEPEERDGEFTGKVSGVPCFREGKVERLEAWLAREGRARAPGGPAEYSRSPRSTGYLHHRQHRVRHERLSTRLVSDELQL